MSISLCAMWDHAVGHQMFRRRSYVDENAIVHPIHNDYRASVEVSTRPSIPWVAQAGANPVGKKQLAAPSHFDLMWVYSAQEDDISTSYLGLFS